MLNYLWLGLILLGTLIAGFTGNMQGAVDGAVQSAQTAVTLVIGLVGIMTLWLGLMRLAEKAGLVATLAKGLRPLLRRLFPDVPTDHPAMGSMVLNIAANILGLNNAATPLGLRAMRDLETLNPRPGTASNAMCTFLAINTGSVQLIPVSAIALLAAAGSIHPTAIVGTTLVTTFCSSVVGLFTVKWLERWRCFQLPPLDPSTPSVPSTTAPPPQVPREKPNWVRGSSIILWAFLLAFLWFGLQIVFFGAAPVGSTESNALIEVENEPQSISIWIRTIHAVSLLAIPFLLAFFPLYAALQRIPVYEEFVQGAKEGFQTAIGIIPYLVAMLVAIGFFRGAGGIELMTRGFQPLLEFLKFPVELLPMALLRPLTGSGTLAALADLIQTQGPDSLVSRMGGTLFGSTETTFYVIAVYFGSVGIHRTRHAIWAGLSADITGVVAAIVVCRVFFG